MRKFTLLLVLGLSSGFSAWGQNEFATWSFGEGVDSARTRGGIRIRFGASTVTSVQTSFYGPGGGVGGGFGGVGGANVCDKAGNVILDTNGIEIVDSRGFRLPDGVLTSPPVTAFTWFGRAEEQPAVLAPAPGREGFYYVFFWDNTPECTRFTLGLRYALVDIHQNGGYGDVVARSPALTLVNANRMTVVRHANNRDFWVVVRNSATRCVEAFLLSPTGVATAPVASLCGQVNSDTYSDLCASPDGRRLAAGYYASTRASGAGNGAALYDFDNATGQATAEVLVPLTDRGPESSAVVSACFSPDSRLLYTLEQQTAVASAKRWRNVYQYDARLPTGAAIRQSRYFVSDVRIPGPWRNGVDTTQYIYNIQLAPDGTIWVPSFDKIRRYSNVPLSFNNSFPVQASAIIRRPNVAGAGCGFDRAGFRHLPGQRPTYAPNLITNMLYAPPALDYETRCGADDSVRLWASSAGPATGLQWDFGDPGSGPANQLVGRANTAHRYPQGGTYAVRLTLADGRVLRRDVQVPGRPADLSAANVFTPNHDGLNDTFRPVVGAGFADGMELKIYARWGQVVYETSGPAPQWDGQGQAAGEYFYLLRYRDCQGQAQARRGLVTLVR